MTSSHEAWLRYKREHLFFTTAADSMSAELSQIARLGGVTVAVKARAKTISSFATKLRRKGYVDPWAQMTDKVGARVIVETLSDLRRMVAAIDSSHLEIRSKEDKSATADAKELFYPGIHYQVLVNGMEDASGGEIECEVQVRTKAQDLWSVPDHRLNYKGALTPERHTQRRIMRLSALVELFDEEVDQAEREVMAMPSYANAQLLQMAEVRFLNFVSEPGDGALSLESLQVLSRAIAEDEFGSYDGLVDAFATTYRGRLQDLYGQFGPNGTATDEWNNWLMLQPESILIFERIVNRPRLLQQTVVGSDLESAVRTLHDLWGAPFE